MFSRVSRFVPWMKKVFAQVEQGIVSFVCYIQSKEKHNIHKKIPDCNKTNHWISIHQARKERQDVGSLASSPSPGKSSTKTPPLTTRRPKPTRPVTTTITKSWSARETGYLSFLPVQPFSKGKGKLPISVQYKTKPSPTIFQSLHFLNRVE